MVQKLQIVLVRSPIGRPEDQRRTLKALGLNKINKLVEHNDTPAVRGMLKKVCHLVEIKKKD